MTCKIHILNLYSNLPFFFRICRYLTHNAAILVANAFVSSHLDCCNSLFRSLLKLNLQKLQCIQNSAARIITNSSRYSHITPILKQLHWLPVQFRSEFKTATLVYKFLQTGTPNYFTAYPSSYIQILTIPDVVKVVLLF